LVDLLAEFGAVATLQVPPDPAIIKTLGLNHDLVSAIADLVDNSIDAGAERIFVRFVLRGGLVHQLLVADDGRGMNEAEIDLAMQLGKPKSDQVHSLGHFGMGLKAASLSQASELTVLSHRRGVAAQGRRMFRDKEAPTFEVDVLDSRQVRAAIQNASTGFGAKVATIIRWDAMRRVPASRDRTVTSAFVDKTVTEVRHHLGLVFHRLLAQKRFTIELSVFDADVGESGFPFPVDPIDPFAYARTGVTGYPKTLVASYGSTAIPMRCHIWPPGSDSRLFKLPGAPVDRFQGFYFYRNDRLLSTGQWFGVTKESKRRRLARVAVDVEDHLDGFTMSAEKSSVTIVADLVHAIERSTDGDGTTFSSYLADAEEAFRQSNRRTRRRVPILPAGQGVAPRVRRALAREASLIEGEDPIRVRWKRIPDGDFVEVDRRDRTLWLNTEYREAVLKGTRAGVNDAPLVKALLFLLYEDIFRGAMFGPKDKDNVNLWLEILTAAAQAEIDEFYE
jgi:hypothetical protein